MRLPVSSTGLTSLGTREYGCCIVADQFEELQREKQVPEE